MRTMAKTTIETTEWHPWFAWRPVMTHAGELVWLETVSRRWDNDLNPWAYDQHAGTDGGWEYKWPSSNTSG